MKAAIFNGPYDLRIEEVEKPAIGEHEVLIRVKACGICGSDLHMYKLDWYTDVLVRESPKGKIPGHEFSGEIVEIGEAIREFEIGDHVCGVGFGALAEYVPVFNVPGMTLMKLPDEVSYEEGATLEPLADALHITNLATPAQGENAMVFGVGTIGLGVIQCLKAFDVGLKNIIAVDISDKRLDLAIQLGATHCINASMEDTYKRTTQICGDAPMIYPPGMCPPAVEIVCDCVGYVTGIPGPPVIQQALNIVRDQTGRIVSFGTFESPVTVDFMPLIFKQVKIFGSLGYTPEEMEQALELMRAGKVDRKCLISHEFSLEQLKDAFETQLAAEDSIKVLVRP